MMKKYVMKVHAEMSSEAERVLMGTAGQHRMYDKLGSEVNLLRA